MTKKDTIIISGPEYDAEEFKAHIVDVIRLIQEILRRADNCDMDASEVANRSYVLDWLAFDVDIKDAPKDEK